MMRSAGRALVLLLAPLAACAGYRPLDPAAGAGRSLAVPPARNESDWIGLELALTRALRADAARLLDVREESAAPDLVLETALVDPMRRGRVGLRAGAFALGSAEVSVEWSLRDRAGAVLASGRETRELEFVTALESQTRATYDEIFRSVSEKILLDVAAALGSAPAGGDPSR